ncbi:hypothetical protein MKW92_044007 [Papaver armeniacum]|nr:hypothetical protein MKW92_044007 [Papaver armeniacum]
MNNQITSFCLPLVNLHLLFFLLINVIYFPLTSHGCHEQDRRALLDFKYSLEDPANRLSSWQDNYQHQNCCNWQGIGCSYDSYRVISIKLRNTARENYIREYDYHEAHYYFNPPETSLRGNFSPSLFNTMTHLEYIDLAYNYFQEAQVPHEQFILTKLSHIDLSHTYYGSSVSTQFNNLSSLHHLDLSGNDIKLSRLKWVRGLVNLQVLKLSGNDLSKGAKHFTKHVSYLSNLRDLNLSYCDIQSLDFLTHEFYNLSHLSSLDLHFNLQLESQIPIQLANLTSLSYLDLSQCDLKGSVPYIPQLEQLDVSVNYDLHPDLTRMFDQHQWPKLQRLDMSRTEVNATIPSSISTNAPMLVSLSAGGFPGQGSLPSAIYNLAQLESLDLYNKNITSYLQSSISNLKFLNKLDLSYSNIQGSIPNSICEMFSLRELDLSWNNLTGIIPSCLTNLKNLSVFRVDGNSIEGSVPLINFINELTVVIDQQFHLYSKFRLQYLNLQSCNLEGLFPTFICKLSNLRYLDISHNHLTGAVLPSCFSKLKIFRTFNLSNNKLSGLLPLPPIAEFWITYFDVSNNKFSGEISTETGKRLSSFDSINLAGNKLSGSIPLSICSKDSESNLAYIDFSNNNLSGVIPTTIGCCSDLRSLSLGTNNLTGKVPNELQQLKSLSSLQLNDNNLHGIPLKIVSKLQNLHVLNLANNHFEGSIPTVFRSVSNLSILCLRSNEFSGSIPREISLFDELQILDLSGNNLTGLIPRKIGNLMMLRSRPNSTVLLDTGSTIDVQLRMVIKGIVIQFEKLYAYSSGIDLSCNLLEGTIPQQIGLLKGLSTLNLSHNRFSGFIPQSIGYMSGLESLDLSFNKLSGIIPHSIALMDSLEKLNLSYNNLSGMIPREPHFDTLSGDGSAYSNNSLLCGFYTNHTCEGDQRSNAAGSNPLNESYEDDNEDAKEKLLLYAIVALGYAVGFWGLFLVMLLKKQKWWFGYWRLVDAVAMRVANRLL